MYLFMYLCIYFFIYLFIYLYIYLFIYMIIHLFICSFLINVKDTRNYSPLISHVNKYITYNFSANKLSFFSKNILNPEIVKGKILLYSKKQQCFPEFSKLGLVEDNLPDHF